MEGQDRQPSGAGVAGGAGADGALRDGAIRPAQPSDAAACQRIYAPYVLQTGVTFETEVPSLEVMTRRIQDSAASHAWLVLDDGTGVRGYAYATQFGTRAAYRWSATLSVYLEPDLHRNGAGRALYQALFERLAARGYIVALAGVTLPNEASLAFHRALGFEQVAHLRGVGWKLGRWRDIAWLQRDLGPRPDAPAEPG